MSIPAGWYDDGSGRQRWWDGTAWTEHFAEAAPIAQPASAAVVTPAAESATASPAAESAAVQQQVSAQAAAVGHAPVQPYGYQPTNGMAITSLILGILWLGLLPVIFGHIAIGQIKRNPYQGGRGMAIAGLVLGYLAIGFWVVLIGIWIIGVLFWGAVAVGR